MTPAAVAEENSPGQSFIDYFQPMPLVGKLTTDTWGAAGVLPRDIKNGLVGIDVEKAQELPNDNRGAKIIVIPFDGAALDRDLQEAAGRHSQQTKGSITMKPRNESFSKIAGVPWHALAASLKKPLPGIPAWLRTIIIGVLAVLTEVPATAAAVDVTHPDNVLAGLAAIPANVQVSSSEQPVSRLTDHSAEDRGSETLPWNFTANDTDQRLAITGFNGPFNTVRIYTAPLDPGRCFPTITLKSSTASKTSLNAADYETTLGTFSAPYTYMSYDGPNRGYFDMVFPAAPAGTKTLFFDGGSANGVGDRIYEIEAFMTDVRLPKLFTDNMMVQRDMPVRVWGWASAGEAVIEDNTVTVSSPEVKQPVAVRYAYQMNPAGANLYNRDGLPASPFRTDDW